MKQFKQWEEAPSNTNLHALLKAIVAKIDKPKKPATKPKGK